MQTSEIFALGEWLSTNVKRRKVVNEYDELIQKLQQNTQNRNQAFTDDKKKLAATLHAIDLGQLSSSQLNALKAYGVLPYIAAGGAKAMLSAIDDNPADPVQVHADIVAMRDGLAEGVEALEAAVNALRPLEPVEKKAVPEGTVLVNLTFQHGVDAKDIEALNERTEQWLKIASGISQVVDERTADFHIIGAEAGSLRLNLAIAIFTADLLLTLTDKVLDVALDVQEYRHRASEAAHEAEKHKAIAGLYEDMRGDAERWENRAKQLKDNAVEKMIADAGEIEPEKEVALRSASKDLAEFIFEGGEVDPILPSLPKQPEESEETGEELDEEQRRLLADTKARRVLIEQIREHGTKIHRSTRLLVPPKE